MSKKIRFKRSKTIFQLLLKAMLFYVILVVRLLLDVTRYALDLFGNLNYVMWQFNTDLKTTLCSGINKLKDATSTIYYYKDC